MKIRKGNFMEYQIGKNKIIAGSRAEAIIKSLQVKARTISFGDDYEVDVTSQVTFVVNDKTDVMGLLKCFSKKGVLLINFDENAEISIAKILSPNNRKYTEKSNGKDKLIKIVDSKDNSINAIAEALKIISSNLETCNSISLVLIPFDDSPIVKTNVTYSISAVETL
jgi:hypothetical protein